MSIRDDLAPKIRAIRKSHGMTQRQFAGFTGIKANRLWDLENAKALASENEFAALWRCACRPDREAMLRTAFSARPGTVNKGTFDGLMARCDLVSPEDAARTLRTIATGPSVIAQTVAALPIERRKFASVTPGKRTANRWNSDFPNWDEIERLLHQRRETGGAA